MILIIFITILVALLFIFFGPIGITTKDIKNEINKVTDKILEYQNNNKIRDIKIVIEYLEDEHKKHNKGVILPFNLKRLDRYFYLPKDMQITDENNEIIIYYKKLIYNVNKGKYI